jgi:hypothetical protein
MDVSGESPYVSVREVSLCRIPLVRMRTAVPLRRARTTRLWTTPTTGIKRKPTRREPRAEPRRSKA